MGEHNNITQHSTSSYIGVDYDEVRVYRVIYVEDLQAESARRLEQINVYKIRLEIAETWAETFDEHATNMEDVADRRLALLRRINEWANETGQCPICRSVSWDGDALMHVPGCELDAECNG